jgi:hypothetical protein
MQVWFVLSPVPTLKQHPYLIGVLELRPYAIHQGYIFDKPGITLIFWTVCNSLVSAHTVHLVSPGLSYPCLMESIPDPPEYRQTVGALQYVTLTRPDIAYSVNQLCQHMQTPTSAH